MQLEKTATKTVYYCYFNRKEGEQLRRRDTFDTLESVLHEAALLHSAGYHGMVVRTFDPIYDEENHSFHNFEIIERF